VQLLVPSRKFFNPQNCGAVVHALPVTERVEDDLGLSRLYNRFYLQGERSMGARLHKPRQFAVSSALRRRSFPADRYPLSPRIQTLRGILAKFGPSAPAPPPPARPPTPEERDLSRRPQGRSRRR
jgi:hypothetical protein